MVALLPTERSRPVLSTLQWLDTLLLLRCLPQQDVYPLDTLEAALMDDKRLICDLLLLALAAALYLFLLSQGVL